MNIVRNDLLDLEAFRAWRPEFADAEFILEDGKYLCGWAVEKMSKSMFNVVNPDHIVEDYGADTLRMYEMFLGTARAEQTVGYERYRRRAQNFYAASGGCFSIVTAS